MQSRHRPEGRTLLPGLAQLVSDWDTIVIGAGYFGCRIALRLAGQGFRRVLLVEAGERIMGRASLWNQARVHGGYHYPRAHITALASRRSYQRFLDDHAGAITRDMRALYAIARGSNVSPSQFERMCDTIGAPLNAAPSGMEQLFDREMVEAVYVVEEVGFDADAIANTIQAELVRAGVTIRLGAHAQVTRAEGRNVTVAIDGTPCRANFVFNCTYAGLDRCGVTLRAPLKREWSEMALIEPPRELSGWGVTVMDGPFFSLMPFPAMAAHTLSHVRFTPVCATSGTGELPALPSAGPGPAINAGAMLRDAARYIPRMRESRLRGALHEIKTVLAVNEADDGRPVLVERSAQTPNVVSILGSKLDNVYDALDAVDEIVAGGTARLPEEAVA